MWPHLNSSAQQQIHWLVLMDATTMLDKVHHPAGAAIINVGYQVRWEVCVAIADEVATLNAGCGTKKKGAVPDVVKQRHT